MPKGKDIYEDLSKKYFSRNRARKERAMKKGPPVPATVNNYLVNKTTVARSLNIQPTPQQKRSISPNEGKPTVNASSDVKGLIHKPKEIKNPLDDAGIGAIKVEGKVEKKKRGRPKKN